MSTSNKGDKSFENTTDSFQVGLALVGLGGFGHFIAQRVKHCPRLALVGGYDVSASAREEFTRQFSCKAFTSIDEAASNEKVDAVFLASPNHTHREQTEVAAKHKKHVFITKPIANTVSDGLAVINVCEEHGVLLFLDHPPSKWTGWQAKMKEMIHSGIIGRLVLAEANGSSPSGLFLKPGNWRWHNDTCPGGALIQLGIYQANTLCYLLGRPKRVHSFFKRLCAKADVPDVTTTIVEFESGVLGYLGSSYAAGSDPFWIQIHGTDGSLVHDDREGLFIRHGRYSRLQQLDFGSELTTETHYENLLSDFAEAVSRRHHYETDSRAILSGLSIVEASVKSAEEERTVEIRELFPDESMLT